MTILWKDLKKRTDKEFRRLSGVERTTFLMLIQLLRPAWNKRRKSGGPKSKLNINNQLLLTLSYWRNYSTYLETGAKYGVSESRAYSICRWIEDNLIKNKTLHLPGKKMLYSQDSNLELVVFDVTECAIERPKRKPCARIKNKQRPYYSGKKKRHTLKEQIVINQKTKQIIATKQAQGKVHDFKIFKKSKHHMLPQIKAYVDSGYQGIKKIHANSMLPTKRSKKMPLTTEQKIENMKISSIRVIVENVFAFIKKFKIIGTRYRNRRSRFGLRFNLICAIFNYENA